MIATDKTALAIETDAGIRLNLANYYRIRTWQGGGEFWEHHNQQLIRDALGQFLPRAIVESNGRVLFQHFENGKEICSETLPVTSSNPLPKAQIDQLRLALTAFKARSADPKCDSDARKLIECFRLPDPVKDPELYRIYGTGKARRLIVLWGAEKELDTAVAPLEAVNRVHTEATRHSNQRFGGLMFAAAVAVLAAIVWLFLPREENGHIDIDRSSGHDMGAANTTNNLPETTPREYAPNMIASVAKDGPNHVGNQTPNGTPIAGEATDRLDDQRTNAGGPKSALPKSALVTGRTQDVEHGVSSASGKSSSDNVAENEPDTMPPDARDESATGLQTNERDVRSSKEGLTRDDGKMESRSYERTKSESAESEEGARILSNLSTDRPGVPSAAEEAPSPIRDAISSDQSTRQQTSDDSPKPSVKPPDNSDFEGSSKKQTNSSAVELTETKLRIENGRADGAGRTSPKTTPTQGNGGFGLIEIIKANIGERPNDGNVEVLLGTRALDNSKQEVSIEIDSWQIDGESLKGIDGSRIRDPNIRHWLQIGKHTVSVEARTKDGKRYKGKATIDVRIRQTPTPEVDLENTLIQDN